MSRVTLNNHPFKFTLGSSVRIGREIQYLPYAGFWLCKEGKLDKSDLRHTWNRIDVGRHSRSKLMEIETDKT